MTGGSLRSTSSTRLRATLSAGVKANPPALSGEATLAYGTGSAYFDTPIERTRTLAAGASETIDLYAGTTLLDVFDATAPLRNVRFIEIAVADGGDSSGLRIGGAASNCWAGYFADTSDKFVVYPGGPSWRGGSPAGVAVTAGTCNLKVENLGAVAIEYTVVIAGSRVVGGMAMGVLGLTYP